LLDLLLLLGLRFLAQFCWSPLRRVFEMAAVVAAREKKGAVLRSQLAFHGRGERSVRSLLRLPATLTWPRRRVKGPQKATFQSMYFRKHTPPFSEFWLGLLFRKT
jgi:hypothetical protein